MHKSVPDLIYLQRFVSNDNYLVVSLWFDYSNIASISLKITCTETDTKTKFDEAVTLNALPYAFDLASKAGSIVMLKKLAKVAKASSKFKMESECQIRISGKILKIMK